jgi:hypothetical protein
MMNTRCQRLHGELDEGLVHRDAMTAHQERPEFVSRGPRLLEAEVVGTVGTARSVPPSDHREVITVRSTPPGRHR